jgi:hypothetical protein
MSSFLQDFDLNTPGAGMRQRLNIGKGLDSSDDEGQGDIEDEEDFCMVVESSSPILKPPSNLMQRSL